jgi:hypothetical protein
VPGYYLSDKSAGVYYLAIPSGKQRIYDKAETAETRWFSPSEALAALALSPNAKGRERDIAVVDAALKLLAGK